MNTNLNSSSKWFTRVGNVAIVMVFAVLGACGGGLSEPVMPPSGLTYEANPAVYIVAQEIATNTPSSSGGAVMSYSVSPDLPAGLILNTTTGVVSGTASSATDAANYTITAINLGGSTTATLSIAVSAPPSGLTYEENPAVYIVAQEIAANTPSSSGGAVMSYSVLPALPAGLSLNATTGLISGTPSTATASQIYTITATNPVGSATVELTLSIDAPMGSPVTINTLTATMDPDSQRVFTASVMGFEDQSVTWSTSPPDSGILLLQGPSSVAYTAPSIGGQVLLTATSVADTSAEATVTIMVNAALTPSEFVFNNYNIGGVSNGPTNPTTFNIAATRHILSIEAYHYFNNGVLPGLLSLRHSDGTVYGPWQTTGAPGQGAVSNAYWKCYPDVDIKPGDYTVIDSDPATWSVNAESGESGFIQVLAHTLPPI